MLQLAKKTLKPGVSEDALAWRSLRGAAVALVGKRRLWEAGRGSLDKVVQMAVHMTSINIKRINRQTGEALNISMMIAALIPDPMDDLLDVLSDLQERTVKREQLAIRERQTAWRVWAATATQSS